MRPRVAISPTVQGAAFTKWQKATLDRAFGNIEGSTSIPMVTMSGGELTKNFVIDMPDNLYSAHFETTWFTQIRTLTHTTTSLEIEFSNPPEAGDKLWGSLL